MGSGKGGVGFKWPVIPGAAVAVTVTLAVVSNSYLMSSWVYNLESVVSEARTDIRIDRAPLKVPHIHTPEGYEAGISELGDYAQARSKMGSFDFIEQYSLVMAAPRLLWCDHDDHPHDCNLVVGYDPELNDIILHHRRITSNPDLMPNEIYIYFVGFYDPRIPADGDTLRICDQLFHVREAAVPPPWLPRPCFFEFTYKEEGCNMVLPMDRFLAMTAPNSQPCPEPDYPPRNFFNQCYRIDEAMVTLVKVRLRSEWRTSEKIAEAAEKLQASLGSAVKVEVYPRPAGELARHLLSGLNIMAVLSVLMWQGLGLAVFVYARRRRRELEVVDKNEGKHLCRRGKFGLILAEALGAWGAGGMAGLSLAWAVSLGMDLLIHQYPTSYRYYVPPILRYIGPSSSQMLRPAPVIILLAGTVTILAALIAALRKGKRTGGTEREGGN